VGLFDKFRNSEKDLVRLSLEKYELKYLVECKYIWKNYVPKNGQATILQGELLREIEKLRGEAQDNGNINWDEDFAYFCDFLKDILVKQSIYSADTKRKITLSLNYIKACGEYAWQYSQGEIADDKVDMDRVAYVSDNLYDIVADAIGLLQKEHPEPIPYTHNDKIKR